MKNPRFITHAAIIAALYTVLTYAQYLLWPESTSMAVQVRISEALCVLAFFTPAAVPGLTLGCLLFNLTYAGTLPLDWLVGTLATLLAVGGMWLTRKVTVKGYPVVGMLLPALTNALLVQRRLRRPGRADRPPAPRHRPFLRHPRPQAG